MNDIMKDMSISNINIEQFVDQDSKTNNNADVFDEIEKIRKTNLPRRFSFSIPDDNELNLIKKSELQIPPVPPSSPLLDTTQKLSILVPNNDFDNFNLDALDTNNISDDDIQENNILDIQYILDFSKNDLLISNDNDKTLYKLPPKNSFDTRYIWKCAKIPRVAYIRDIEYLLLDWAFTFASLEISNRKIISITWKSKSNCLCKSSWQAFLRWIICASFST